MVDLSPPDLPLTVLGQGDLCPLGVGPVPPVPVGVGVGPLVRIPPGSAHSLHLTSPRPPGPPGTH